MDNAIFVKNENITLVMHHDEDCDDDNDYDDHHTLNTGKVNKTEFTMSGSTDKQRTSTSQQRQKVKRDKLTAFCRT